MQVILLFAAGLGSETFAGTIITSNLPPNVAIINIDARADGSAYFNSDQSLFYQPFNAGGAAQLLTYGVAPGSYTFRVINPADAAQMFPALTSDQTNEIYTAWTFNSPWVTDYLVFDGSAATNISTPQLFDGAFSNLKGGDVNFILYPDPNSAYIGAITNRFYNLIRTAATGGRNSTNDITSYTFTSSNTLIFAVPDPGLGDNAGGVSVLVAPQPPGSPTGRVAQVSAGWYHTLFVMSDGSAWGMGDNSLGQLGQGPAFGGSHRPVQIMPGNVTGVSAGAYHSLFVEADGSLWAVGDNSANQLGDERGVTEYFPERIVSSDVTSAAAGVYHSLFRTISGHPVSISLWAMGYNFWGELGDGSDGGTTLFPEQVQFAVSGTLSVSTLAAGSAHSLLIKSDGSLWGMGDNDYDQLGLGDFATYQYDSPTQLVSPNVIAIAAGDEHSLFIKAGGSLWGMGDNSAGDLGDGTTTERSLPVQIEPSNVTAIAAGLGYSLFVEADGSLWAMGFNNHGQLGDGTTTDRHSPALIVTSNVVAVAAGGNSSFFIKSDGSLWAMGLNGSGQLGDGTTTERHTPVRIVPVSVPGPPVITGISVAGTNLVLTASNGVSGRTYLTLMSVNFSAPMNQWIPVAINVLNADGAFTITATNAVDAKIPQRFYRLELQN